MRCSKLYMEANLNESTKNRMIIEAIYSDQSLLHFVLIRKHQKVYFLPRKVTENFSGLLYVGMRNMQQGTDELILDKMDMLCKSLNICPYSLRRASRNGVFRT